MSEIEVAKGVCVWGGVLSISFLFLLPGPSLACGGAMALIAAAPRSCHESAKDVLCAHVRVGEGEREGGRAGGWRAGRRAGRPADGRWYQ
jgi:hypothetical protein